MATYTGYFGVEPEPADYTGTDSTSGDSGSDADPSGIAIRFPTQYKQGFITGHADPSPNTETFDGHRATSFHDDYFERIHVVPQEKKLGLVPQTLKEEFEVYNAYLDTAHSLDGLNKNDTEGIELKQPSSPVGQDYYPDFSRTFKYDVTLEGPVNIDAEYEFLFPDESPSHFITGQRSIVWAFIPMKGITEILKWNTDIMRSRNGNEQRKAVRKNPRRKFEMSFRAAKRNRRLMENILQKAQARDVLLPVWTDWRQSKQTVSDGDATIPVDTTQTELAAGNLCMIMTDPFSYEIREIETVSSSSVTLTTALDNDWPQGSFVVPCIITMIENEPEFERINDDTIEVEMLFRSNTAYNYFDEGTQSKSYKNREVSTRRNYNQQVSESYRRQKNVIDTETGTFKQFDKTGYSNRENTIIVRPTDREEMLDQKRFLFRRKGQQNAYWQPSWLPDIKPVNPIQSSATRFDIEDIGYSVYIDTHEIKNDLRILLEDGSVLYREVVGATSNNDGTEELEIDASFGQLIDPADIYRADFLELARLNADRFEIEWKSRKHGKISMPVRTVKK